MRLVKSSPALEFHGNRLVTRSSTTCTAISDPTCLLISSFIRSFLSIFTFPWITIPNHLSITPSLGRKVTGTLFGNRHGHVSFAIQIDPRSVSVLLIRFSLSTATLVKEMSSGLVRIVLECEKTNPAPARLIGELGWTMYCNGRKYGYAASRACNESDWHVLSTVQTVSVGAGVIPVMDDGREDGAAVSEGELMYMRARFERILGNCDSEAFYMLNPDGNGRPELSIFLPRI